ncbi:MAG TPA: hypothetical protein VF041_03905 [Gemmatimonadaceae bacterium]
MRDQAPSFRSTLTRSLHGPLAWLTELLVLAVVSAALALCAVALGLERRWAFAAGMSLAWVAVSARQLWTRRHRPTRTWWLFMLAYVALAVLAVWLTW